MWGECWREEQDGPQTLDESQRHLAHEEQEESAAHLLAMMTGLKKIQFNRCMKGKLKRRGSWWAAHDGYEGQNIQSFILFVIHGAGQSKQHRAELIWAGKLWVLPGLSCGLLSHTHLWELWLHPQAAIENFNKVRLSSEGRVVSPGIRLQEEGVVVDVGCATQAADNLSVLLQDLQHLLDGWRETACPG